MLHCPAFASEQDRRYAEHPDGPSIDATIRPVLGNATCIGWVEITLRQNMTEKDLILKLSDKFIRLYPGAVGLHGKDRSVALNISS